MLLVSSFLELNSATRTRFYLSLVLSATISFFDLILSNILSGDVGNNLFLLSFLFLARLILVLLANYSILSFSVFSELDLKAKSLNIVSINDASNLFSTVSFTTAHTVYTGLLRIISDLLIVASLVIYIFYKNQLIILYGFYFCMLLLPVVLILNKISSKFSSNAANDQKVFLSEGGELVAFAGRARELGVIDYIYLLLRNGGIKYAFSTRKSLFFAQSYKPIIEFLAFSYGLLVWREIGLEIGFIYLLYRLLNYFVSILNQFPTTMHYYKQYVSCYAKNG